MLYIRSHIIEDCCENGLNVTNVKLFLRLSYLFLIFLISPYPYICMFLDSEKKTHRRGYGDILMFSIYQFEHKFNNIREKEERNVYYILLKKGSKKKTV